jgi:hypothetical protein
MEKNKYRLKLHYVINYIIFDFFITLFFWVRQMIKVYVKNQSNKYLGMERVPYN